MMNAERHLEQQTSPTRGTTQTPLGRRDGDRAAALSALADGEIDPRELDGLLEACDEQTDVRLTWHSYQVIGDVLRGSAPAAAVESPQTFLAGIQSRLQAEPVLSLPVSTLPQVRAPAANEAVFRWKMVAGVASLAAVMAVSWSVLSGAPSSAGGAAGPQMALMQSPPVAAETAPGTVLVSTDRGTLIRDARLEELLAEHRQFGGMSALQMPAGFLRDATHDVAPKR